MGFDSIPSGIVRNTLEWVRGFVHFGALELGKVVDDSFLGPVPSILIWSEDSLNLRLRFPPYRCLKPRDLGCASEDSC